MEKALRMIKSKTKVSGGFRSCDGAVFFGNTMSIIKTSILRKLNPLNSIMDIMMKKYYLHNEIATIQIASI